MLHVEKEVRLAAALKLDEGHDTRDKKKKRRPCQGREREGRGEEETKYSSSPSCSGIDSMVALIRRA